jgi:site-specific DNA recombinase
MAKKNASLHHFGPIKWYMDDGATGVLPLDRRPVGIQLVTDARAGLIELLLIYRLDRLGSNA